MLCATKRTTKQSGVDWLGDIPADWAVKPLFAVVSERQESNVGMKEGNLLSLSYGKIVPKSISSNDGLLPESFETYQLTHKGDVVWRLTDLQNDKRSLRTALVGARGIVTSAYLVTAPTAVEPTFLSHVLRGYDLAKVFYAMGGGVRQSMKFADVRRLPILIPPLEEQCAISRFLDRETDRIDALIEKKRQLLERLEEKRLAVIAHAVTKGLNPDAKMKDSGIDWLGKVPAHWRWSRFKFACERIIDCKNRTPEEHPSEPYFVVRTSCVRDGKFFSEGGYQTDEANFIAWTYRGMPRSDDVLFTREAPTGEACLPPAELTKFCLGQRMMALRHNPDLILPEFLVSTVYGPLVRFIVQGAARGSTVGHLRVGEIGDLPCLLPPINEQTAIVSHLAAADRKIGAMASLANDTIEKLAEYRSALIIAAVTGKVDLRGVAKKEAAA